MSKYQKRAKNLKLIFLIVGLGVIPLYAIIFSQFGPGGNLILVTFSQIGARYGAIELFTIWGILTSLYYLAFLSYLTVLTRFNNFIMNFLIGFGVISMLVTVFLPFAPSMYPRVSKTHNLLAYVTAVSTLLGLVVFVGSLYRLDLRLFTKSLIALLLVIGISIIVLLVFGVSSLFQIVFSTLLCVLLCLLLLFIEKSPHINIEQALYDHDQDKEK